MILKKPYAFLIKQFRLIHTLLAGSIFFVFLQTDSIIKTFGELVSSGKISTFNKTSIFVYIFVLIIVLFCLSMFWLMRYKKKPRNFYLFALIYYSFFLIMIGVSGNIIYKSSLASVVDVQSARAYYDLARIIYYPQLFFLIFSLFRGIGFDIKKFDFNQDLVELDISKVDNEEFEFVLGFDYRDYLKKFRKYLRELKYYFLENHIIIITILIIFSLVFTISLFYQKEVVGKVYSQDQIFNVGSIQYTVTDSFITNIDKAGEKIVKDYYYLVISMNIRNLSSRKLKINLDEFNLVTRTGVLSIDKSQNQYFADLGDQYRSEYISSDTNINKLFAFRLDNFITSDKYQLNIFEGSSYSKKTGQDEGKYAKVNLKPSNYINIVNNDAKYFGTEINFDKSTLKNSSLNIKNYSIQDNYIYNYELCFNKDDCRILNGVISSNTGGGTTTLLILDYDLKFDKNSTYNGVNKDQISFFKDFIKVDFIINEKKYSSKVVVKNPNNYKDQIILEVSSLIKNANKIELIAGIRDQKYTIYLK